MRNPGDNAALIEEASRLEDRGEHADAARCYFEAGDQGGFLEQLIQGSPDDDDYPEVCLAAVYTADELDTVSPRLVDFLQAFVSSPPRDETEQDALYRLGDLYETHGLRDDAKQAFRTLMDRDTSFRDVVARWMALVMLTAPGRGPPGPPTPHRAETLTPPDLLSPQQAELATPPDLFSPHRAETLTPPNLELIGRSETVTPPKGTHRADTLTPPELVAGGALSVEPEGEGFEQGATIAGRYVVQEQIGRGGMAIVYRAVDLELAEELALKVFTLGDNEDMIARFREELKLSRRLQHPNVVRLYDMGQDRGHRYITMELLTGSPLQDLVGQPVPLRQGLDILIQAAAALQATHDVGVVHRDVKPDNLFLTDEGVVKLMDFGIAKIAQAASKTATGIVLGTPYYLAPEQFAPAGVVCPATDQYALGVVAYALFTGTLPFQHELMMQLLLMHANEPPESPRRRNPEIPEALEEVILRLLEKDSGQRYESCRELGEHLERLK